MDKDAELEWYRSEIRRLEDVIEALTYSLRVMAKKGASDAEDEGLGEQAR